MHLATMPHNSMHREEELRSQSDGEGLGYCVLEMTICQQVLPRGGTRDAALMWRVRPNTGSRWLCYSPYAKLQMSAPAVLSPQKAPY